MKASLIRSGGRRPCCRVWRNARERITHFYAPYPGQTSAEDFMTFYNNPKTLFAADINSLYK